MTLHFNPRVIAHRGASASAPENTIDAFAKAAALGCHWIEFDVMRAACGTPVVFHDDTLDRTTNGQGELSAYPYSYLKTLDAGSWFGKPFANAFIPSLEDVIQFLKTNDLYANVEIKPSFPHEEEGLVKRVVAMISAALPEDRILYSSFSISALQHLRVAAPTAQLGLLLHAWEPDWQMLADRLHCVSIHVNHEILNPASINIIKQMQKKLLSYTVNDVILAKKLYDWGVDAVFSDVPDLIMNI